MLIVFFHGWRTICEITKCRFCVFLSQILKMLVRICIEWRGLRIGNDNGSAGILDSVVVNACVWDKECNLPKLGNLVMANLNK